MDHNGTAEIAFAVAQEEYFKNIYTVRKTTTELLVVLATVEPQGTFERATANLVNRNNFLIDGVSHFQVN